MKVMIEVTCPDCDLIYEIEALDPVVENGVLESYMCGSTGWYCERCDSANVQHTGWRKERHLYLVK